MSDPQRIAIAFTLNDSYAQHCCTAMVSALENNRSEPLDIYVLTDYFSEENRRLFNQALKRYGDDNRLFFITVDDRALKELRLNITYITHHTYYRFLLPTLLPELDRILYLDADLVVDGPLRELWQTPLDGWYCGGVRDTWIEQAEYKFRIGMKRPELYINAGVILMNLARMREEQITERLMQTAREKGQQLDYQDQDVLNLTLRGGIKELPGTYNYMATDDEMRRERNPVIIHYNGNVKPWSTERRCRNSLAPRYFRYLRETPYRKFRSTFLRSRILRTLKKSVGIDIYPTRIKVALLSGEYCGAFGTARGPYGYFASQYIARYLQNPDFAVNVLLPNTNRNPLAWWALHKKIDKRDVVVPPRLFTALWLKRKGYDLYLCTEPAHDVLRHEKRNIPVILWELTPERQPAPTADGQGPALNETIEELHRKGLLTVVSNDGGLDDNTAKPYGLPHDAAIGSMPAPVRIDYEFDPNSHPKKELILLVGDPDKDKNAECFRKIAERLPQYEFIIPHPLCGEVRRDGRTDTVCGVANLKYVSWTDPDERANYLRDAKLLIDTSEHMVMPILLLEGMAYGALPVSRHDPEGLVSRFGRLATTENDEDIESAAHLAEAARELAGAEALRSTRAREAVAYIREVHPIHLFQERMRTLIRHTAAKK